MKHSYELDEDDILQIIAEKFGCDKKCVYIRSEKGYVLGAGSTENIKATIHINQEINFEK